MDTEMSIMLEGVTVGVNRNSVYPQLIIDGYSLIKVNGYYEVLDKNEVTYNFATVEEALEWIRF